jgi:15-cis-phytoene synthase
VSACGPSRDEPNPGTTPAAERFGACPVEPPAERSVGPPPSARPSTPERDPASVLANSSFSVGVLLLPGELQADARRLYQLLRTIDDLVDEGAPQASDRVAALERWAQGEAVTSPETKTLAELSERYPLPRAAFADFCRGMRLDLEGAEMRTEGELERYCEFAGGTVGLMLSALFGATDPETQRRMLALGTAMQRTNILRDIDEDLERGRVYIATSTIQRFGFPHPGQREELFRDQIARADALFAEGFQAIPMLGRGRRAMGVSALFYREILRQIEREGFGRRSGRVEVPPWRKKMLISRYPVVLGRQRR